MDRIGERDRQLYVGVDGGGTKTLAQVTDGEFRVLGEGRAGPSNFLRTGLDRAVLAVERAICIACLQGGVRLAEITAAGIGLAGLDHEQHRRTLERHLRRRLAIDSLLVTTDAEAAVAGATDLEPGVVVIAGTGSAAYGVDSRGRSAHAGGWGPVMGDEGSGYDIARRALAAVAGALDGRLARTSLTARVCERFGVERAEDLLTVVYGPERIDNGELASLATIVEEEARAGDATAREILADAGRELGAAVRAVVRRLGLESSAFRVAYVGGVFRAGELVLEPLAHEIARTAPKATLAPPLFGPAVGAAKLAARDAREGRHDAWEIPKGA